MGSRPDLPDDTDGHARGGAGMSMKSERCEKCLIANVLASDF